jgi:hypothetical protein
MKPNIGDKVNIIFTVDYIGESSLGYSVSLTHEGKGFTINYPPMTGDDFNKLQGAENERNPA